MEIDCAHRIGCVSCVFALTFTTFGSNCINDFRSFLGNRFTNFVSACRYDSLLRGKEVTVCDFYPSMEGLSESLTSPLIIAHLLLTGWPLITESLSTLVDPVLHRQCIIIVRVFPEENSQLYEIPPFPFTFTFPSSSLPCLCMISSAFLTFHFIFLSFFFPPRRFLPFKIQPGGLGERC